LYCAPIIWPRTRSSSLRLSPGVIKRHVRNGEHGIGMWSTLHWFQFSVVKGDLHSATPHLPQQIRRKRSGPTVHLRCKNLQTVQFGDELINKKLSYRRVSAHRTSLRLSRSFKVIDSDTNRCDFLLVNNTNLTSMLYRFTVNTQSLYHLWQGVPLVNAFILGNLCEYHNKSNIAKTRFFGLHFVADSMGLATSILST